MRFQCYEHLGEHHGSSCGGMAQVLQNGAHLNIRHFASYAGTPPYGVFVRRVLARKLTVPS
jgi:hypothetical protein